MEIAHCAQKVVRKLVPQICRKLAAAVDSESSWQRCPQCCKERVPFAFRHNLLLLIIICKVGAEVFAFFESRLLETLVLSPYVLAFLFEVPFENTPVVLQAHNIRDGRGDKNTKINKQPGAGTFERPILLRVDSALQAQLPELHRRDWQLLIEFGFRFLR